MAIIMMAPALTAQRFSTVLLREKSSNLRPVFLRHRRDNTIQAQVLDKLSVVVGDMPDGNHRDAEFGVRSGVTTFHTVERIICRERGEDSVRVVEGVLEILNQLGFGFRRIVTTLFAVFGRFLALKFVEKRDWAQATCFTCSPKLRTPSNLPTVGM